MPLLLSLFAAIIAWLYFVSVRLSGGSMTMAVVVFVIIAVGLLSLSLLLTKKRG